MRFEGTKAYVATDDLKIAVNAAITLERPLLVIILVAHDLIRKPVPTFRGHALAST